MKDCFCGEVLHGHSLFMQIPCAHSKKLQFTALPLKQATGSDQDLDLAQVWSQMCSCGKQLQYLDLISNNFWP